MDAPADAWTVFFGVGLVSIAMSGIVVSLPIAPPPDANAAGNAIDDAAGSSYGRTVEYEHDAEVVQVNPKEFGLKNDGGAVYKSISFGTMTPVAAGDNERLRSVIDGKPWQDVFDDQKEFLTTVEEAKQTAIQQDEWRPASGTLRAKTILVGDERVTLVEF